jgi:uncharacterized membrane protein
MCMSDIAASPLPLIQRLHLGDIFASLRLGWRDFLRAPMFGLFFSAVYVLGGLALIGAFGSLGYVGWVIIHALGFPLIAPFAAVGLYEVSHKLEQGGPLCWDDILGAVWRESGRQIPWIGAIIVIIFLFWFFLSHMIFAVFMGLTVMTNISTSLEVLWTLNGLSMLAVQVIVGGGTALLLFALTAVSLPLLLDKEVDFVTAMILSVQTVSENFVVMMVWAVVISVILFAGLIPLFLGLFIALPVLGHATWHLYRRALSH